MVLRFDSSMTLQLQLLGGIAGFFKVKSVGEKSWIAIYTIHTYIYIDLKDCFYWLTTSSSTVPASFMTPTRRCYNLIFGVLHSRLFPIYIKSRFTSSNLTIGIYGSEAE